MSSWRFHTCGSLLCGPTRSLLTIVSRPLFHALQTLRPANWAIQMAEGVEETVLWLLSQHLMQVCTHFLIRAHLACAP